jgi:hypothetical protein
MKAKKIITVLLISLTTFMVVVSGLMKAIHLPWSVEGLINSIYQIQQYFLV